MTDIVERLEAREVIREYKDGSRLLREPAPIQIEAAAEITRLRERVAELESAVKVENEACAVIADGYLRDTTVLTVNPPQSYAAFKISRAIRARMNKESSNDKG